MNTLSGGAKGGPAGAMAPPVRALAPARPPHFLSATYTCLNASGQLKLRHNTTTDTLMFFL